jgi:CO dehydrogenase maturation factor
MVCGKGGSGKSAVSVLMARALPEKRKVCLIDSDESNVLLPKLLGVKPPKPIVEYLGGKKGIFPKGEVNIVNALAKAGKGIKLDNLPTEYVSASTEGIRLVTIGKVRNFGEGCACPLNFLTKTLLKNLALDKDEIVLVDTDAGIEHVGRGVEEGCDAILAVVDPTAEALMLAKILKETFQNLNKEFWLILNKATPKIIELVKEKAKEMNLEINGVIRFDEEIFESSMDGRVLHAKEASADVEGILKNMGLI